MRRNKFGAKKTNINGIIFDSKAEANHYIKLKHREKIGEISFLELQPKFLLQDKFKLNGKTHRKIDYEADFKYFDNKLQAHVVVDVKGMKTKVYSIKMKMFLKLYSDDYIFIEVYKGIEKTF